MVAPNKPRVNSPQRLHSKQVAVRHQRKMRKQKAAQIGQPQPTNEYLITDPHHKPDLRGELGGGKVYVRGNRQYVRLTPAQARFYLDGGNLQLVVSSEPAKLTPAARRPPPTPALALPKRGLFGR